MPVAAFVMATALVALAGFATQRGTICAVQAGRDVVERRSRARFVSFLECTAWSALIFIAVMLIGFSALAQAPSYELGLIPIIGGAVFGLGALACHADRAIVARSKGSISSRASVKPMDWSTAAGRRHLNPVSPAWIP